MKKKFKSILVAILNSFSQKYFREIEIYYLQVKKFIDSIKITRLPKGLNGLTIINSAVLINSENLMSHQSNKYFFEVYNSFEVSSESEEEKFEEKPEEIEKKLNEDYKTSKENQEKPQVEYVGSHGFILMTCIHEFAHFIERSQIKKVSEWFSLRTPRDFSSNSLENQTNKKLNSGELKDINQNLLTVEGNQMNQSLRCVEGGRIFMRKIFGFEVETLNHYQALFILNPENWNMNQDVFQEKFKSESNKENPPEYAEYYPVRCMVSSNPFLIEIGECGTASGFKWSKNYNFS